VLTEEGERLFLTEIRNEVSFAVFCEKACVFEIEIFLKVGLTNNYGLVYVLVIQKATSIFAVQTHQHIGKQFNSAETVMTCEVFNN